MSIYTYLPYFIELQQKLKGGYFFAKILAGTHRVSLVSMLCLMKTHAHTGHTDKRRDQRLRPHMTTYALLTKSTRTKNCTSLKLFNEVYKWYTFCPKDFWNLKSKFQLLEDPEIPCIYAYLNFQGASKKTVTKLFVLWSPTNLDLYQSNWKDW